MRRLISNQLRLVPAVGGLVIFVCGSLALLTLTLLLRYGVELQGALARATSLGPATLDRASEVFDRAGTKIGEFAAQRRYYVSLRELPAHLVDAFLSAEDRDFWHHRGISPSAMARAGWINLRRGGIHQGASTITQQLARHFFLDPSRNFERKLKEVMLAVAIEQRMDKERILELYLNTIYLGNRSYGVEAAARNYFRKPASQLTLGEAALLAGLPKAPSYYAPHRHPERATQRQAVVLQRMVEDGVLTDLDAAHWRKSVVAVAREPEDHLDKAPHFVATARAELERKLELERLPQHGLRITSTLDAGLQEAAQAALRTVQRELVAKARPFHKAMVGRDSFDGALVVLDQASGAVRAMVGGADFARSQFNRAVHAKRRIGGLIVPVLASLALERGYTLATPVGADPLVGGRQHAPSDRLGPMLYEAVVAGDVLQTARLFARLGAGSIVAHAGRVGLPFAREDASLALGYGEATPFDVATSFASLLNGGRKISPYLIAEVFDAKGQTLYRTRGERVGKRVLSDASSYLMQSMLRDAARAERALHPKTADVGRSCGASDDLHNAWCAGFAGSLIIVSWVGSETGRVRLGQDEAAATQAAKDLWWASARAIPRQELARSPAPRPRDVVLVPVPMADGELRELAFVSGSQPALAADAGQAGAAAVAPREVSVSKKATVRHGSSMGQGFGRSAKSLE